MSSSYIPPASITSALKISWFWVIGAANKKEFVKTNNIKKHFEEFHICILYYKKNIYIVRVH